MIEKIEVRTVQGTLLTLTLADASSGFIVENIDGLDPVKASIASSSFASMDGTQYQSSRRESRNIVFRIGLEPDYTVDTVRNLRTRLYNFFMPKSSIALRFYMTDGLIVDTTGRIESFETPIFTQEPAVTISIICFDPDFIAIAPVVINGNTVSTSVETLVTYEGTTETGFTLVMNVDRVLGAFTVYNRLPDGSTRTLDFSASLVAGDVVTISTVAGAKFITRLRSGITTSLLYGMTVQSDWIEFTQGNNYLRVYAVGAAIPYVLTYTPRYGGL